MLTIQILSTTTRPHHHVVAIPTLTPSWTPYPAAPTPVSAYQMDKKPRQSSTCTP